MYVPVKSSKKWINEYGSSWVLLKSLLTVTHQLNPEILNALDQVFHIHPQFSPSGEPLSLLTGVSRSRRFTAVAILLPFKELVKFARYRLVSITTDQHNPIMAGRHDSVMTAQKVRSYTPLILQCWDSVRVL